VWRAYTLKEAVRGIFRPRPDARRRRDPHRPTPVPPGPQPPGTLHPRRQDDPQAPRRHPRRRPPRHQPRPHRSPQRQGPTDRPPRLRLPHRRGRPGARDAHLRPNHAAPPAPASRRRFTVTLTTSMPREPEMAGFAQMEWQSRRGGSACETAWGRFGAGPCAWTAQRVSPSICCCLAPTPGLPLAPRRDRRGDRSRPAGRLLVVPSRHLVVAEMLAGAAEAGTRRRPCARIWGAQLEHDGRRDRRRAGTPWLGTAMIAACRGVFPAPS
jgi:hypothetical protein